MDTPNLFLRIEDYAKENFTTETLAYILETDATVRKAFLDLLLNDRPKLRKALRSCQIETQPSFDLGRPDLVITSEGDTGATVIVEVKTQSQEGKSQIRRYLKLGNYVAYLTPRGDSAPYFGRADAKKYLRQFFWDDVHSAIQNAHSRNILHRQFLNYLEARGMAPLKPISKNDLKACLHAADIVSKFKALVENVRKEIEPAWVREFGTNTGGKNVVLGVQTGNLPSWWFRPKDWKKREKRLYLCLGVFAENGMQDGPRFYVGLGTNKKKFGRKLEMNRKFKERCKRSGWKLDCATTGEREWYKSFAVTPGNIDDIAQQQIKNVRSVGKEIHKLVKFVKKEL